MAIKATFATGEDTVTTKKSLHQWDYGQQLEIEAVDLSPIIEVHFACQGMSEAEVRPCTILNGIATVTIPDRCLEQSSNITAWVFEIDGTRGMTTKTITIPVKARTKPSKSGEIPQEFKDCYTELISEVNEAIKYLSEGDVTAKYALAAGNATSANTAGHANTSGHAGTATTAENLKSGTWLFGRRLVKSFGVTQQLAPNTPKPIIALSEVSNKMLIVDIDSYGVGLLGAYRTPPFYVNWEAEPEEKSDSFTFKCNGDEFVFSCDDRWLYVTHKSTSNSLERRYYVGAIFEEICREE